MTRYAFMGCVQFSARIFEHLLSDGRLDIAGVITLESSPFNDDFESLAPIAEAHAIPCLAIRKFEQGRIADQLRRWSPDIVFCIGWSHLLDSAILSAAPFGVIGYHPTLLPRGRGRHPIVWALALGLTETGSTFFAMDVGADSGDIVHQVAVSIDPGDNATSLYRRLQEAAVLQMDEITDDLLGGGLKRVPQHHAAATSWRKRGFADGAVDWRMPATGVHNLVRALARPYAGAHCVYRNFAKKIWRSRVIADVDAAIEPGRVIAADADTVTVKCGEGAIVLLSHDLPAGIEVGEYL